MIVFGQNHFKIKSFTQEELGLPRQENLGNIDIQVRQRYAHLFWIPFFPIGKVYGFKRPGDSNLYELPDGITQIIQARYSKEIRTPWYSYFLIVAALVVGAWIFVNDEIKSVQYENDFYMSQAKSKMMVKYPTTGDFYVFEAYNRETGYKSTSIVLKVNSYDEDTVEFTSGYKDMFEKDIYDYQVSREFKKEGQYVYRPTRIKKDLLLKMIAREYGENGDRFKMSQYDDKYFRFKKIERKKLEQASLN